jgi:hypothetical protein
LKHITTQIDEEFVIFEKYSVTPNELFFLKMLLLAKEEDSLDKIQRYFKLPEESRGSIIEMLKSLKNKGIILSTYKIPEKGMKFSPLDVPLSQNFQKHFFKASFDLGKDLFDHYPISTVVNGIEYKLRRVSKKFDSLEDCFRTYGKYIRWSQKTHEHVIELVEWGKANGYQFTSLADFVVDQDWLNIEDMKENGTLTTSNLRLL